MLIDKLLFSDRAPKLLKKSRNAIADRPLLVYKKQDSFAELRHHLQLKNILPRIQKVYENLESLGISAYQKNIVKNLEKKILLKFTY